MLRTKIVCLGILAAAAGPAVAETPLERGAYLVNTVAACGNCHTPVDESGNPVAGMELAGRFLIEMPEFTSYPPNITPDPETGIGDWSEDDIVTALREGRRPDGTIIGPPMPIELYRELSDSDARAIAAYVKSVPAVSNTVQESVFRIPLPESYGPPVETVADVPRAVSIGYGAYLAGPVGHCTECHTPMVEGRTDFEHQLGAGGREFPGPWGVSVSANLTSDEAEGIAEYTDDDLIAIITTGKRPDSPAAMLPPMPYRYYSGITEGDLRAIIAYLRTLPPKPSPS